MPTVRSTLRTMFLSSATDFANAGQPQSLQNFASDLKKRAKMRLKANKKRRKAKKNRHKQLGAAAIARVFALLRVLDELAGIRALGAGFSSDMIDVGRQHAAPLSVAHVGRRRFLQLLQRRFICNLRTPLELKRNPSTRRRPFAAIAAALVEKRFNRANAIAAKRRAVFAVIWRARACPS